MSPSAREYLQHILDETAYIIVKQLPNPLRQKYSAIDWRAIAGMRDRLIHKYFGVDYDIVWDVVTNKVPELNAEVIKMIDQEFS